MSNGEPSEPVFSFETRLEKYWKKNQDFFFNTNMNLMLGLHYVPGGHGSPGSPKRSAP